MSDGDTMLVQMVSPRGHERVGVYMTDAGLYYVQDDVGGVISTPCDDWRLVLAEAADWIRSHA